MNFESLCYEALVKVCIPEPSDSPIRGSTDFTQEPSAMKPTRKPQQKLLQLLQLQNMSA